MLELEEGETVSGSYTAEGFGQYTIVAVVHPVAKNEVYVSLQFSSGNIEIQPNLMVDIGQPTSATIDKIRLNLLVEKMGEAEMEIPDSHEQSLTQNSR